MRVLGSVNLSVQPDSIAHADHDIRLVELLAQVWSRLRAERQCARHESD
jgi:hypothetical protein